MPALRMRRPFAICVSLCGVFLLLIAVGASDSGSRAIAVHAMPCSDVDGDGSTTILDLNIESSWFGLPVPPAPAAADMDGDTAIGVSDITFVGGLVGTFSQMWTGAAYVPCQDTPFGWSGGAPPPPGAAFVDTDGDGCSDVEEGGPSPMLGGTRDYLDPWDFFDTDGNKLIDLFTDIFGVSGAFGADGDALAPPMGAGPNPEPDGYSTALDRSGGSTIGTLGPPDGVIDLFIDVFGVANQFGHDCTAPPN